jgi:nitrite reductase/ring-hydroxylating ferredoxin subunit
VDGCVKCPWHGSEFRLDQGTVQRGPASVPEPAWDVKVADGRVAVRSRAAA